ncbi:nitroreductase [Weizmannia acidilactici]|uniref:Nitroreductase n=1 Tax=Weizmannia acidilactici TaxID=2607726 RepID=A0A5J4JHH8_9BACI|nr:nitroreductase family protein [Weizmannia acidilactici]GER68615.1 nitroreductase [Weizmannia acidilactici]GER71563.1 nitroreductase [Weizmannia acidilactici]GER73854.1 nitroreductase [Weizmannia acidilactici]
MVKTFSPRKAQYEIDPVYLERWSPRSFLEKEVPEDVLMSLFEAARWAPSAFNHQPWRFIIARTKEDREKFMSFIGEFNKTWCKTVPSFALVISKTESDTGPIRSHAFDAGAAWGYLSLEAVRKGLATHPMTGFDFEKAREVLNIPEDYAIDALIAIGYQGEKDALPVALQERETPSDRRPVKESVFEGSFGKTIN